MKKILFVPVLAMVLFTVSSCEKEKGFATNSKVFRTDLFRQNIQSQLNNATGYTLVITQNGIVADSASSGLGYANPSNGQNGPAAANFDINIASVTKAYTAMAAIQLMEDKGILMNFPIGAWLPNSWPKNAAVSNITFRELLTHTSGIRQSNTSWDSLKSTVASPLAGTKTYSYSNANFGLFRALLPKLNDAAGFNVQENNLPTVGFETWMSLEYIDIMNERVFNPALINNAMCNVSLAATTMQAFNEINNPPLIPCSAGDWTNLCGGGGFYLSTLEMARVMAYLVHTENILSASQRSAMDAGLLGWDPNDSFSTTHGQVYGKDGALFWDNNNDNGISGGDSGLQTWVGKFPNKVELALSVTSIGSNWRNLPALIQTAYENSWVEP